MTKAFFKYFLFAFILLSSGVSHALSVPHSENLRKTQEESLISSEIPASAADEVVPSIFIPKAKHHLEPCEVELEEKDDEKYNSLKRQADAGKFFLLLSFVLVLGYFHRLIKKRSPSSEQSYHFSFYKWFILFRVFRI